MTEAARTDFQKRLQRIERKHAGRSGDYVPMKQVDGLTVPVPKRRRRNRRRVSLRGLTMTIVAFTLFKAVLLAHLGPVAYESRLDALAEGSLTERIGARVFAADPLSAYLAGWMGRVSGLF